MFEELHDKMVAVKMVPGYDKQLVKTLLDRGVALCEAGISHAAAKTRAHLLALQKAYLTWNTTKVPTDSPELVKTLMKKVISVNTEFLLLAKEALLARQTEATSELRSVIEASVKYAGGGRDCESWKAQADSWTLAKVIDLANTPKTGLLAGPGAKVVACKDQIKQVP